MTQWASFTFPIHLLSKPLWLTSFDSVTRHRMKLCHSVTLPDLLVNIQLTEWHGFILWRLVVSATSGLKKTFRWCENFMIGQFLFLGGFICTR